MKKPGHSRFGTRLAYTVSSAFLGLLASSATTLSAQSVPTLVTEQMTELPVHADEAGIFNGKPVSYIAAIETTAIQADKPGKGASIVSFSYTQANTQDLSSRPVLFVFNGGPIAASLYLHIGAVGPYRVRLPEDVTVPPENAQIVENPYSPLDVADIVFFDPALTGFSTLGKGVSSDTYYTVEADGEQLTDFITTWLADHNRASSPVFMLGESYGTIRAAETAGQLAELGPEHAATGVFLMGQAVNMVEYSQRQENIISFVVSLPTLASIAWEKDKVSKEGLTFESFMAEVRNFGETDYLLALFQGQNLDDETLLRISEQLSRYTGIPTSYYVEHNLRITKETYRRELLRDEGLVLGRSDARYTAPYNEDGRAPDASGTLNEIYQKAFGDYVEATFGIKIDETYQPVHYAESWYYGPPSPFSHFAFGRQLSKAFDAKPDFRLFIANGYQDTMTTVGAADYAVSQSDWPLDRVKRNDYQGGHMAYSVESSAEAFGNDIRNWILGWSTDRPAE